MHSMNLKPSEIVENLYKSRGKITFSMRELLVIFNSYKPTKKGELRQILREAKVADHADKGKHSREVWVSPAIVHAAREWEAQL